MFNYIGYNTSIKNDEFLERSSNGIFMALFQLLPRVTEENYEILQSQYSASRSIIEYDVLSQSINIQYYIRGQIFVKMSNSRKEFRCM